MRRNVSRHIWMSVRRTAMYLVAGLGWLFVQNSPSMLLAATSDALSVTITPRDNIPPAAVVDLSGTPGGVGQMFLQWTAPDSNNNLIAPPSAATSYQMRVATFSIDSLSGDTTAWWTVAQDVSGEPVPSTPGTTDSLLLNGLDPGVTYYAGLISYDAEGLVSPIDTNAATPGQQAHALIASPSVPTAPTNFVGVALSSQSIQWSWDAAASATYYALVDGAGSLIAHTTSLTLIEVGLPINTQISRAIRAGNISGISSPSTVISIYTLAAIPTNLTITNVTANNIAFSWDASGNPSGTLYRLERSLNAVSYVVIATQTATGYLDTGLSDMTTYYYRTSAINGDGFITATSVVVSTVTLPLAPDVPMGLKGLLDSTGRVFTLIWEPVTQNADGTPITDLAGYHIYRRTTLGGTPTRLTASPQAFRTYFEIVDGQTFYFTVRAIDTTGHESLDSLLADSSSDTNIIFVGQDNLSTLFMPSEVNDLLRPAYNKYGVPLTIGMTEEPIPSNTNIIRHVELHLLRGDTRAVLSDLAFAKPQSVIAVAYNSLGGQVGYGSPLSMATETRLAAISPNQLSLYWNNNVTWVKVGGTLDQASQTVKIKSSYLGSYQLRVAATATSLTLDQANVYPRVFTPNGDGFNDRVYFVLENPNNSSVMGIIYDLGGRTVATLGSQSGTGIGTTLTWDGKDTSGAVVPGGAYIYKIKGEGKTFTGTVGVAR